MMTVYHFTLSVKLEGISTKLASQLVLNQHVGLTCYTSHMYIRNCAMYHWNTSSASSWIMSRFFLWRRIDPHYNATNARVSVDEEEASEWSWEAEEGIHRITAATWWISGWLAKQGCICVQRRFGCIGPGYWISGSWSQSVSLSPLCFSWDVRVRLTPKSLTLFIRCNVSGWVSARACYTHCNCICTDCWHVRGNCGRSSTLLQ